ncbi:DUF2335 domain-containing protein [Neorhizobium petrolearium]|uniref:DUF2335 domain-containing protein n=1 Tax=Neorhizobium petrolearium TaxID=515361 RepID=A0ABY8LZP0_9HYPH|nr:DUF2335 domain-containing protein [Neorhizobium petrolearium]MCC2612643.1 DUF2335 domain-containing protein [Neorhizobium petrolearium]WGI67767.1 DUF2335 domain-containing protein [Neorhizobium petrolearium]
MAKRPPEPRSTVPAPPKPPEEAEFAKEIERRIGPLVPSGARGQVVSTVMMMMSEQFSGPIAHPRHLREYEEILPGSAERIIQMAERQQQHNIDMESRIVSAQVADQKRGMRYGMAALVVDIAAAAGVGMYGNNVLAGMILGVGVAGVVAAFIKGRHSK